MKTRSFNQEMEISNLPASSSSSSNSTSPASSSSAADPSPSTSDSAPPARDRRSPTPTTSPGRTGSCSGLREALWSGIEVTARSCREEESVPVKVNGSEKCSGKWKKAGSFLKSLFGYWKSRRNKERVEEEAPAAAGVKRVASGMLCFGYRNSKSVAGKDKRVIWAVADIKGSPEADFFTEYGEASRYQIQEVVGKGSYGVVGSAVDTKSNERVAIKKINDVFEHVSDATRILREIKLLRLLRHPDIVEIKHIMLPPSRREFRDIYVVFELMESDLHQVIKANDDLTPEHYQFFLYQLLRGLKYIHTANVFHRDLKPKNILANADCKLKICDFGLARVSFNDAPSAIFWTDYVATRWYRAPELCGSFFSKYTPAIDMWSIGCIFAEMLTGKPLFPGKNVVHQLDLMTDLLGTPPVESISRIRNEKARRYLSSMRKKQLVPFTQKFPNADPLALSLLERLLAFDPKDRPTAEEALADPYFNGLSNVDREPSSQTISKLEFEFERRKLTKDDVRELIYREILEYHPQMLQEYLKGGEQTSFMYPSGVDRFKRQFAHLEEHHGKGERSSPLQRQHASLPRERVPVPKDQEGQEEGDYGRTAESVATTLNSPPEGSKENGPNKTTHATRSLLKSASISASKCIGVKPKTEAQEEVIAEVSDETINELANKVAALHNT